MPVPTFNISQFPSIRFGSGTINTLAQSALAYGTHALLVTGSGSVEQLPQWQTLQQQFSEAGIRFAQVRVCEEPSPQLVDRLVEENRNLSIDCVIGLGGGSVLDAAKAIAGLLRVPNSVIDFLEGVGPELPYPGPAVPFIAIPTTAGTGSEATKNAVLSVQAREGYKKSFRDDRLVPDLAIVDPDLLASCPPELVAANGMDALTQLLESYVSLRANPLTDSLAVSGLEATGRSLLRLYKDTFDAGAREDMAYAALLSGITLAQTGLGSVHGLASPLGAFFPIPHGVVCGTLVATATEINIRAMKQREPDNPALKKYADIGRLLGNDKNMNDNEAHTRLVGLLAEWTDAMQLQRLSHYGVGQEDFEHITRHCRGSSMQTNPIRLEDSEITEILRDRC